MQAFCGAVRYPSVSGVTQMARIPCMEHAIERTPTLDRPPGRFTALLTNRETGAEARNGCHFSMLSSAQPGVSGPICPAVQRRLHPRSAVVLQPGLPVLPQWPALPLEFAPGTDPPYNNNRDSPVVPQPGERP